MQTIVPTIGISSYVISNHLVNIIQPIPKESENNIKDSSKFINEAKEWPIGPKELQTSYDVINLNLSVPLDKVI